MHMLKVIAEPIGLTLGSLLVGLVISIGLWAAFRHFGHERWGLLLTATLVSVPLFVQSMFLDMTVVFAVVSATALWLIGRFEEARHAA